MICEKIKFAFAAPALAGQQMRMIGHRILTLFVKNGLLHCQNSAVTNNFKKPIAIISIIW